MNILRAMTAWVRNAFGVKPGELGDIYAAVELIAGALMMAFALLVFVFK